MKELNEYWARRYASIMLRKRIFNAVLPAVLLALAVGQIYAFTIFSTKIAEQIGMDDIDRQIYIDGINIRVNLDGTLDGEIIEIKTYKYKPNWKPSKDYRSQVQVEMWADKKKSAMIVAYALEEDDYEDWTRPVDAGRLSYHPFDYDVDFIIDYLPRVIYLSDCIDKGLFPRKDAYESQLDEYQRRAKDYYVND